MAIEDLPDFSEKTVVFTINGRESGHTLEKPTIELQAGRLFVVGTIPKGGSTNDWAEGVTGAVAWDQVTDYLVFDSPENYQHCLDKH